MTHRTAIPHQDHPLYIHGKYVAPRIEIAPGISKVDLSRKLPIGDWEQKSEHEWTSKTVFTGPGRYTGFGLLTDTDDVIYLQNEDWRPLDVPTDGQYWAVFTLSTRITFS